MSTSSRRPFVEGEYYATPAEKQRFLRRMFDVAAPHYEGIIRWGWFGTGAYYRRRALLQAGLAPGMRVLDVASGTGPVARAAAEIVGPSGEVVCAEPSAGMIAQSRRRLDVVHHQCGAEAVPEPDAGFDFLTMGFALRHVDDLDAAFAEFRRLLKPGGRALVMDVIVPPGRFARACFKLYFKRLLPGMTTVFTGSRESGRLMRYYYDSMEQMTPSSEVAASMRDAGFAKVEHSVQLGCFSEWLAER